MEGGQITGAAGSSCHITEFVLYHAGNAEPLNDSKPWLPKRPVWEQCKGERGEEGKAEVGGGRR